MNSTLVTTYIKYLHQIEEGVVNPGYYIIRLSFLIEFSAMFHALHPKCINHLALGA